MTSLYRHYDEGGHLLYVGISNDALRRLTQHGKSPWARAIARVEIAHYSCREDAKRAERLAILAENPLYNVQGRTRLTNQSRRDKERERKRLARRAAGAQTREEYLAAVVGPKPWVDAGVCKSMWYRKRRHILD